MNDFLPVDKMTCLLDFIEGHLKVVVPRVERLIGELSTLREHYDTCKSVDLRLDSLIDNHVT